MLIEILQGVLLILVLVISSGLAVEIFEKIAHEVKVNKLLLATFLVSFSTSLPEFSVGIASAFRGQSQIALGNLMGANLANISWIVGGAAVVAGVIPVIGEYLKKDLYMTMGLAVLPFFLMLDGSLSRLEGVGLILIYFVYIKNMISAAALLRHSKLSKQKKTHWKIKKVEGWVTHIFLLILAFVVMAVSSHYLINVALRLTEVFNVDAYWVGLLAISLGTTLPELALSIFASERKDMSLLLGNILGSVVVNSSFILGIIALISPIEYEASIQKGISGIFLIITLGLFWLFTKSKRKLERWEGVTLIGIYLMFVGLQFLFA